MHCNQHVGSKNFVPVPVPVPVPELLISSALVIHGV